MRLSDSIENFIKTLLTEDSAEVELKRNELAEYFGCAPSQINYVLATRFSPDHGYLTESRRGGGDTLTEEECLRLISQLKEQQLASDGEAAVMASAVSTRALGVPIPDQLKDALRARMMKSMLMNLAGRNQQ